MRRADRLPDTCCHTLPIDIEASNVYINWPNLKARPIRALFEVGDKDSGEIYGQCQTLEQALDLGRQHVRKA